MGNSSFSDFDLGEQWNRCETFFSSKKSIAVIVVIMGSIYPMILKLVKGGEETTKEYPFMIGVAICIKNLLMLCYYSIRFIKFHYSQQFERMNIKIKHKLNKMKNERRNKKSKIKYHRINENIDLKPKYLIKRL